MEQNESFQICGKDNEHVSSGQIQIGKETKHVFPDS